MVVLSAFGGTRGTDRPCGGTTGTGWYWRYYGVIEEYCGVPRGTFGYGWVILGVGGYWMGEY